jgi:hypothetical protein
MTDLIIETPTEIRKKLKKMNFREITDLVAELDMETSKMIKYDNKTNSSNYKSTIMNFLKIRKVLEKEARTKMRA